MFQGRQQDARFQRRDAVRRVQPVLEYPRADRAKRDDPGAGRQAGSWVISYGTYLYAWPVQQLSALYFDSFWSALFFSLILTFVLATFSAIFIERPALRLKVKPMRTIRARPFLRPGKPM